MRGRELREALHEGKRVYGTAVLGAVPHWVATVRSIGLDFVFLDTEHTPIDRMTLAWMATAYEASGLAALVRIPAASPDLARPVRDTGASGIIAPYVEQPETVSELVAAVKLRPLKGHTLRKVIEGERLDKAVQDFLDEYNENAVLVANIESLEAIDNLDEIVRVPGLDAVLIGPHDLSISIGQPVQYDTPEFDDKVRYIIRTARRARIGAGIHFWASLEQEIAWIKAGANLIVHSNDLRLGWEGLKRDIDAIKRAVES